MTAEGHLVKPQLQPRQVVQFAYQAGWKDLDHLVVATAVCLAESDGFVNAYNDNLDASGKVASRDVGLWEINIPASDIGSAKEKSLYDPATNVAAAYALWKARGWQPWAAFNSNVYADDSYLLRACLGVMNFSATLMMLTPSREARTVKLPLVSLSQLHEIWKDVPV